jgi:hypothetical protein
MMNVQVSQNTAFWASALLKHALASLSAIKRTTVASNNNVLPVTLHQNNVSMGTHATTLIVCLTYAKLRTTLPAKVAMITTVNLDSAYKETVILTIVLSCHLQL